MDKNFYLIQAGMQEFICNILDESEVVTLGSIDMDSKTVTYVKNINKNFININNIFQENNIQGQKPQLQRLKGTVMTLNVYNINSIAIVPEELKNKLNAAVSGLLVP